MKETNFLHRWPLCATATAIAAAGLLAGAAPAQGLPPIPLAPGDCAQWGFPGVTLLDLSSGEYIAFLSTGPNADGEAKWVTPSNETSDSGTISGSITGSAVHLAWYGAKRVYSFEGKVGPDGTASGTSGGPTWTTGQPMICAQAGPKQGPTATVVEDVDVYDAKNEPDGVGHVVGILRGGKQVGLVGSCAPSSWCQVSGDSVPGGTGWVWGHLQLP
jgi:hypothetical protein